MGSKTSKKNASELNVIPLSAEEINVHVVILKVNRERKNLVNSLVNELLSRGFHIPHYKRFKLTKEQVLLLWPPHEHTQHIEELTEGSSVSALIVVKESSKEEINELRNNFEKEHLETTEDMLTVSESDVRAAREVVVLFPEIIASRDLQECRMSMDDDLRMEVWEEVVAKLNAQRSTTPESATFDHLVVEALLDCYMNTGPPLVAVHEIPHRYPNIFDVHRWVREPMACGRGWYKVVDEMASELNEVNNELRGDNNDDASKSGLFIEHVVSNTTTGQLTVKTNASSLPEQTSRRVSDIISRACHESSKRCELCGQAGRVSNSLAQACGEMRPLCKDHHKQLKSMLLHQQQQQQQRQQSEESRGSADDDETATLTNDLPDDDFHRVLARDGSDDYEIEVERRLSTSQYAQLKNQILRANRIAVKNAERKASLSVSGGDSGGENRSQANSKKKKKALKKSNSKRRVSGVVKKGRGGKQKTKRRSINN